MLKGVIISLNIIFSALACNNAPLLKELERRARNYEADGKTDPYVNDLFLGDKWYSVKKNGEQYLMPDSSKMPKVSACGGREPIYMKGTHPDVNTLTSTAVDVKACLKNIFDDCDIEYNIKIRKCNKEIQYYLVGTKLYSSFCFDPLDIQNGNSKFSDPPADAKLGDVLVNPILDFTEEIKPGETYSLFSPFVKFECKFEQQIPYFYAVYWYLNGALYKVFRPTQNMEDLLIAEKTIYGKDKINLGFTLKCGVRVSIDKTGRSTPMVSSPDYFAGIKILNPRVDIQKNNRSTVHFKLTVPFGCRYTSIESPACFMELNMFDPAGYQCDKANVLQVKDSRICGLNINGARKGEFWDYDKVYNFTVETGHETYNDRSDFTLQLKVSKSVLRDHAWWSNYQPDNIQVIVSDNKLYQNKTCYAHVDPHMRTADGYNYECQEQGEYLMYRNTFYQIEVLMKTDVCNEGKAQCICHLIIRAGADIFSINLCQKPRFIEFLSCADGGILRVVQKNDRSYQVYTPVATYIDITIHGPGTYFGFMNVDIHMSPKDLKHVEGLCGYMDGDPENDLMKRNKAIIPIRKENGYHYHSDFIRSWRLKEEENLFKEIKNIKPWQDINALYCVCEPAIVGSKVTLSTNRAKALCSATQYLDCDLKRPTVTNHKCNKISNNNQRSKRSARHAYDKHIREAKRLMRLANRPSSEDHHVKRRSATERNITESEAQLHCANAIGGSYVMRNIPESLPGNSSEAVIEECIFDVIAGNDLKLADPHVDAINSIAQAKLKLDPVYVANNTAEVEIFIKNSCPGNCSQRGNCSNEGVCECDQYLHGSDCSIDERDPVVIDDLEGGGLCNRTDGDGCECFYFRTVNLLSNFTCAVSGTVVYIDGTEENITTTVNQGEYEDIFTGLCCVQRTRSKRSVEQTVAFSRRYDIAISNDGQNFGAAEQLHVYDSKCQDAVPDGDKGYSILLKDGYCFIDGMCFSDKETSVSDDCLACEPHTNVYSWTQSCKLKSSDDHYLGVILGTTLGTIAIVLIVIGLWYFKIKPHYKKRKSVGDSQRFDTNVVEVPERENR